MRKTMLRRLSAAFLTAVPLACASGPAQSPPPSEPGRLTNAEMEAIVRARADSARMRFTDADVRFMTAMIHHHAQAIEVSRLAPARTDSRSIRTLAARVINAQQDEIATMQTWLRDRGQPVPELHITDEAVMVHSPAGSEHAGHAMGGMTGMMDMPGMLTPDQIRQLGQSRGEAFDRLYLTLLIEHHNGAVTMVHELFATDGAAQDEDAFRLASDIQVDQVTEVARMERMLAAMPDGSDLPDNHSLQRTR